MSERWTDATWLGKRKSDDSHICGLPDGTIEYTRSIRVRDDKWDFANFDTLKGVPWILKGTARTRDSRIPESVPFPQKEVEVERENVDVEAVPRMFQITDELIANYGFTVGCRRCLAMRVSDPDAKSKRHSNECRARLENEIQNDPNEKRKKRPRKLAQGCISAKKRR